MSKTAFSSSDFIINATRYKPKMTEQCTDLMHNSEKLTFSSENLDIANEIDCVEEKESLLNFPFDHMYACNSDSSELTNNCTAGESEVKHLKELLLVHLDLIQQQSEQLINKDKQIRSLKRENEMLKQRLDRMERRFINHINNSNIHSNNKLEVYSNEEEENIITTHENTLYTENIYTENNSEDTKSDIKLLDIHLPQHNNSIVEHNNDSESQDIIKEHHEDEDGGDGDVEEEELEEEHSEEEEEMVTEMRVKRNSSTDGMLEKAVKCYKSRNLLNRNRSPPCTVNTLSKLREELTKPILPKRSKIGDQQQQQQQQQSPQINNENSVEASSSAKHGENRRSRHRKNRINSKRKRLCSGTSMVSNNSSIDCKKSKVSFARRDTMLTTEQMYYTQMGNTTSNFSSPVEDKESSLDTASTTTNLEVPSWRIKVFTSCYTMEGTENLDDDVFNKRHLRLENDERRRKRWDVQRIREQRHIEKLKQRQERVGSGGRTDDHISEPPTSLWPSLDDIKYIEITEHLPVTAFGVPIAQFTPSEFSLPWLNENSSNNSNNTSTNIPSTKKSKKKSSRRRSSKR